MFENLIRRYDGLVATEKLSGNIVKEEFHKGTVFGLRLAESMVVSARQNAVELPGTDAQQANNAIGLLRAIAFHIDEIKFGCLQGLESDIRKFAAQLQ